MRQKILFTLFAIGLLAGCSDPSVTIDIPEKAPLAPSGKASWLLAGESVDKVLTTVYSPKEVTVTFDLPSAGAPVALRELEADEEDALVSAFVPYGPVGTDFVPFPEEAVTATLLDAPATAVTREVKVTIDPKAKFGFGDFLYPIVLDINGSPAYRYVHYANRGDFSPLTKTSQKPLPANTFGGPARTEPMRMIAYVETNDWDPRNLGNFLLADSKKPVFDIIVLFAANMTFNAVEGRRTITFNDKLTPIVENPEVYIRPLQDRGIKVLVDILPHHQGVGFANFQSYEEALAYAQDLKVWADKTGIDGWDVDEEYANYSVLPSYPRKSESWMWFAKAMKEVMPDKLLTLYDYGHAYRPTMVDEDGKSPKDYFDLSWANYGENHSSYAGLADKDYGMLSIEASRGGLWPYNLERSAQGNLRGGYGSLMIFNMRGDAMRDGSAEEALSAATKLFYGEETIFHGKYYPGPSDR